MLPTKFQLIWQSGSREEDFFLEINQSETRIAVVAMFVPKLGQNEHSLERTFHRCFLPSFGSFGQAVSEERIFITTTQKQELPVAAMFGNGS